MNTMFSDTTLIIIFILIFICIGATAFLAVKANLRASDLEENCKKPKENNTPVAAGPAITGETIYRLSKRIDELEERYMRAAHEPIISPIEPKHMPIYEEKSPEIDLSLPKPAEVQIFYMSTPNPDGSFEASHRTDAFRPTVSLYKFTVDAHNNAKARFEFHSDESSIKDVLNNPKTYLEPVCHETNNPFSGARKIHTLSPGLAVKSGERWVVEKNNRAQIKYE